MDDTAREIFFKDSVVRLDKEIKQIEQNLGLPSGVIADIGNDTDYLIILKIATTVESVLNDKIQEIINGVHKPPKVFFDGVNELSDIVRKSHLRDKIKLAHSMYLITEYDAKWIALIFQIRNRYAHHISNFHLSMWDVARKIAEDNNDKSGKFLNKLFFDHSHSVESESMVLILHVEVFIEFINRMLSFERSSGRSLMDMLINQGSEIFSQDEN